MCAVSNNDLLHIPSKDHIPLILYMYSEFQRKNHNLAFNDKKFSLTCRLEKLLKPLVGIVTHEPFITPSRKLGYYSSVFTGLAMPTA